MSDIFNQFMEEMAKIKADYTAYYESIIKEYRDKEETK